MLLLLRFYVFYVFLNPKKRDFLRFFALLHTFSGTMVAHRTREYSALAHSMAKMLNTNYYTLLYDAIKV